MAQLTGRDGISNFKSISGLPQTQQRQQQLACDRCRGQKLRCIRARDHSSSCERCLKAGAICIFNPSIRMGRPQRGDKRQAETGIASQRKHQRASSSASSTIHEVPSPTNFSNTTKDEIVWYPDALDPKLEDTKLHVYPFVLFSSDDMVNNNFDITLDQEHQALPFDPVELQFEENLPQTPADTSAHIPTLSCIEGERTITHVTDTGVPHVSHTVRQTFVERVSSLNLELLQQLSVMNPTTKNKTVECDISTSLAKFSNLSAVTPFMVQKLHTFQELLLEIFGSLKEHSLEETATPVSPGMLLNNRETDNTMENNLWHNIQLCPADMLSLADSVSDTITSPVVEQKQEKAIPVNNNNIQINAKNSKDQMMLLDIPTSLLIISCYINLIHLCRDVFAAIRESLLSSDHKMIFTTLSGFQISGISLQQDSDLQIIVLTQAVVRLVDKIGRSLGSPFGTTSEGGEKSEDMLCSRAILPQLLDFVLRMEDIRGERLDRVVIEALKDEIRKLNKVVYKPV